MSIKIVRSVHDVRQAVADATSAGKTTCLVPTMGGLHAGHMSLVKEAEKIADFVIVSIFVNPTQFNNDEDFENYPSEEAADLAALGETKANLIFAPSAEEMYPEGFATTIDVAAATEVLCDAHRPGHFDGVATVVAKLFLQTGAEFACFGEKDFQQLFIIKRLVSDLNIPIEIVPVATVREVDGLALSSRNARLDPLDRKTAPMLNQAMRHAVEQIKNGTTPAVACNNAKTQLEEAQKFKIEYFEVRSGNSLQLIDKAEPGARLFAAAWLGEVRLIDNIAL